MQSIIDGKEYDTKTAKMVGDDYHFNICDWHHYSEELYQKANGEFFLYGEGGPLSSYAVECKNKWCSGERITPLTIEEAKAWIEEHLSVDPYEEYIGEVEE